LVGIKEIGSEDCDETDPCNMHGAVQLDMRKQYEVKGTAFPPVASWNVMFTEYCELFALVGMNKEA